MGQRDTGCVGSVARWGLGQTEQSDHHECNLLFFRGSMADHGALHLGWRVWVHRDGDSTEGGEQNAAAFRENEAGLWIPSGEAGLHRGTVGMEFVYQIGEKTVEFRQPDRVFVALGPQHAAGLETGPISLGDDQRPTGGAGTGIDT